MDVKIKNKKWEAKLDRIKRSWYKFSRNKLSVVGLITVLLIVFIALFAKHIVPYPKHAGAFLDLGSNAGLAPGRVYLLGTDQYGRDILSRTLIAFHGAILMGVGVLAVAVPIGVLLGLIAGYFQGKIIGPIIMRTVDIFLSLPPLILALAVSAVLRPTLFNSMMALTFSWWAWYSRMVYSMVSSLRNDFYVKSAELIGASSTHILLREILPNCLGPILTKMTLDMGWVILMGASLSFVGMGEQPPTPALGTMVAEGAKHIPHMWWLSVFPAIAIIIIILAFNLLGDGVRDMLSTEEV